MSRAVTLFLTVFVAGFVGCSSSGKRPADKSPPATAYKAKISMATARKAALARVPGTVLDQELEKEDGRWIYTFDIRPTPAIPGKIKEVHVDPDTGKVLKVEIEKAEEGKDKDNDEDKDVDEDKDDDND